MIPAQSSAQSQNGDILFLKLIQEEVIFIRGYDLRIGSPMTDWFARPILNVTDVEASLRFYIDQLGFTSPWRYDEDGRAHVAQVDRQGCALILADTWPEKIGNGLMFISLDVEPATREAAAAALDALRAELEAKGVPVKDGSWGYRLLVVDDPDGNQLLFNYPAETAYGKTARERDEA
jgi:catechol 2,3-dioxygenase-like lactoylglutathione lyase family enzyme